MLKDKYVEQLRQHEKTKKILYYSLIFFGMVKLCSSSGQATTVVQFSDVGATFAFPQRCKILLGEFAVAFLDCEGQILVIFEDLGKLRTALGNATLLDSETNSFY